MARAEQEFDALAKDTKAPRQLHARAISMASLIRAGGEGNQGTVPPPAPQSAVPDKP
jgi:hypothetical protein